jgi:hypothetical protein
VLPPSTVLFTTPVIVRRQMLPLLRVNWTQMS